MRTNKSGHEGKMSNLFKRGFDRFICGITSENEISSRNRRLLSLFFTFAAIVLGYLRYNRGSWEDFLQEMIWPTAVAPEELAFQRPGFIHALLGLLLCVPLYVRNILPFKLRSPYYYFTLGLNVCFFAVIAQLVFGLQFSFSYNLTNTIIIAALLLTWLGIRSVAGFAWIFIFGVAAYNLLNADARMSDFGIWFLLCGFFSLLFQSDLTPREMFGTFKEEFRGISRSPRLDSVRRSMNHAVRTGGRLVTHAAGIIR